MSASSFARRQSGERPVGMARHKRFAWIPCVALASAALAASPARADDLRPPSLAVLPIKLLDTSGEPTDQAAQHAQRLARLGEHLAADLTRLGLARATPLPIDGPLRACPSGDAACLLRVARDEGAEWVFVGVVHKSSTLILQLWARLVEVRTGRDILSRDLNFRGDTDEAWQRAERFLAEQIRDGLPPRR